MVSADHQGNPSVGQNQTLRLITQDKVVAMLGAYHSSVALTATAAAERQGIPFLVADSVALNITQRSFKWTFRVGPIAPDFAKAYTAFLNELKKSGKKIEQIAVVNENTDYGTRTPITERRSRPASSKPPSRPASRSRRRFPTTRIRPTCPARCCN
jgi:branched-chain amino acid transport system substrate-binding protein